jgi:hypothetical protein
MDGMQRVASVDIRTIDKSNEDQAFQKSIRYQYGNHLGSCCLELDEEAKIISYEEYYPYGGTSYHAVRSHTELPP